MYGKSPEGEAGEARHFSYQDSSAARNEVWYEDSDSIIDGLGELSTDVLPESVGLVFVGLGRRRQLFADLAEARQRRRVSVPPRPSPAQIPMPKSSSISREQIHFGDNSWPRACNGQNNVHLKLIERQLVCRSTLAVTS